MKKIIKILIVVLVFTFVNMKTYSIKAATKYDYVVSFNYNCIYTKNNSTKIISSGNNVKEISVLDSKGSPTDFSITLLGDQNSNIEVLENNGFLNSTEIQIIINCNYTIFELYLYDSFGNLITSSGTSTLSIDELIEDTYVFSAICSGVGTNTSSNVYEKYHTECTFTFSIDLTNPTISGASLSKTGKYVNTFFTVYGKDDFSGIKSVYMSEPGSTTFQNIGQGMRISSSKNGIIYFYAIDNAGNKSSTYYVYYDDTVNIGKVKLENGSEVTTSSISSNFYYEGDDVNSGVSYMQYKRPSDSLWIVYNGEVISKTSEEGIYQFRTVDKAGNVSEISSIYLYSNESNVKIVAVDNSNEVYLTWDGEYDVLVNSTNYNKNEIISKEGTYNVQITNSMGLVSNITFTISCYYELIKIYDANCLEDGYSLYKCISCAKEIKTNVTSNGNHLYNTIYLEPSCLNQGGIYNYCTICGEDYMTNIILPLGHDYITSIAINPTCSTDGLRIFSCSRCEESKQECIKSYGHEYQEEKEIIKNNITYKQYKCIRCNSQKQEEITIKTNSILIYVNDIIDTYANYLITILIFTSCIWSFIIGIKIIISTKKDENEKIKSLIKNYIIGLIVIFVILLAVPYLIKAIANI